MAGEAAPAEGYRRIGLRVAITGSWEALLELLRSLDQATPRMLIDDLQMRILQTRGDAASRLDTSFTIAALRNARISK
jgi:hypothetical protein